MDSILGILLGTVLVLLGSAVTLWIIGKLGLGLEVDDFGSAFVAAIVIGVVSFLVHLVTDFVGITGTGVNWVGIIANIIVAAVILMISDKIVKGMRVAGFLGALVAVLSIGIISGLADWVASLLA